MKFSMAGIFRTRTRIVAVAILLLLVVASLACHICLHVIPSDYKPCVLAYADRKSASADFRSAVMDVLGAAGVVGSRGPNGEHGPETTTVRFSQRRINQWLGSLDAGIIRALAEAGLSQPSVSVDNGYLTVYAIWRAKSMIVSLRLRPEFDSDGRMRVEIVSVSLGVVKIPRSWLEQRKAELLRRMQDRIAAIRSSGRDRLGPLPARDAESALTMLLDAARGRRADLNFPPRYGLASVNNLELDDGEIVVHIKSRLGDLAAE